MCELAVSEPIREPLSSGETEARYTVFGYMRMPGTPTIGSRSILRTRIGDHSRFSVDPDCEIADPSIISVTFE
jgi:hypothetical protein